MQDHCKCPVPDDERECLRCWLPWRHDGQCEFPVGNISCNEDVKEISTAYITIQAACEAAAKCDTDCDHTSWTCEIRKLGDI